MSALPDSFALPPDVLAEQDASEFFETRRCIIKRPHNRLAVADRQREHAHHPPERILEPACQVRVIDPSRGLQHALVADWETSEVQPSDPARTYVRFQLAVGDTA